MKEWVIRLNDAYAIDFLASSSNVINRKNLKKGALFILNILNNKKEWYYSGFE